MKKGSVDAKKNSGAGRGSRAQSTQSATQSGGRKSSTGVSKAPAKSRARPKRTAARRPGLSDIQETYQAPVEPLTDHDVDQEVADNEDEPVVLDAPVEDVIVLDNEEIYQKTLQESIAAEEQRMMEQATDASLETHNPSQPHTTTKSQHAVEPLTAEEMEPSEPDENEDDSVEDMDTSSDTSDDESDGPEGSDDETIDNNDPTKKYRGSPPRKYQRDLKADDGRPQADKEQLHDAVSRSLHKKFSGGGGGGGEGSAGTEPAGPGAAAKSTGGKRKRNVEGGDETQA